MIEITFITVVGQILLPLALVIRLARAACRSRAEWVSNALSVAAYLALIAVAGIWLLVPWYVPCGLALLGLAGAVSSWRRCGRSFSPREVRTRSGFRIGCNLVMTIFCAGVLTLALRGVGPPVGPSIDLASPLKNGMFFVVNGGYSILINPHMKTLKDESLVEYRAQGYAVDIVRLDRFGRRARGWWPADLHRYHIFGEPVYAPCAGVVARSEDRLPDLTPPDHDLKHPAGNFVLLECAESGVLMAHLRQSSITVRPGERVRAGDRIAQVGNSGLSLEPHLHLHAQQPGNAENFLDATPLPLKIDGRAVVRNDRLFPR
jgi:hypothetical protein